ncbi:MAG: MAPEG family protein [Micrococcales bacterium]
MWTITSQEVLALTVVALWAKAAALSLSQVIIRVRSKRYGRPEDARMMGYSPAQEDERIERLARAWRNEAEATPAFLALAIAYVLCGGAAFPFSIICLCFVAGRYSQGWAQFALRQPHRTIAFLLGFAASIALAVLVIQSIIGDAQ